MMVLPLHSLPIICPDLETEIKPATKEREPREELVVLPYQTKLVV